MPVPNLNLELFKANLLFVKHLTELVHYQNI